MIRFGSSGIRGLVNRDITPELAVSLGRVLGAGYHDVVVGRDARLSGDMLCQAITAGLLSSGASVTDVGVVSTPTLAFETRGHDCGVMVTASHNPAPYNGMKLWNPNGRAFDTAQQELVESGLDSGEPSRAAWEETGNYYRLDGAPRRHSDSIVSALGRLPRDIRVVLDCGGGAGSTVTPTLLKNIGVETVTLNAHIDGSFSARPPEPARENLALLSNTVRDSGADIGIAHDGDADRMVATDENGSVLDGDVLFCLFARWLGARSVVCPVDMSSAVELNLPGVEVKRTRVGDVYVAETLANEGAAFGGEASGTWIFPEWSLAPDGPYAAAFLCKLVAEHGSLEKAVNEIKRPIIRRGKYECKDDVKDAAMNLISAELEKNGPSNISRLDGIMVETDGGRMLVRPSGTEPVLRLSAEAQNNDELGRLWGLLETTVRKSLEGLN